MENSVIFASRMNQTMGSYRISLDDDLVAKVERLLKVDGQFQTWLQKQVEALLSEKLVQASSSKHSAVSDEALSEILQSYPPLKESDFPNLNEDDYSGFEKRQSGRLPKGIERWL